MTIISTTVGKNPLEEMKLPSKSIKKSKMQYLDAVSKMTEWSLFVSKENHLVSLIQVYAPTTNDEEAEDDQFYEDLQDLLELTPPKDVFFIIGDWNAKVRSQQIPGVTGKFALGVQNEAGQRLTEFC